MARPDPETLAATRFVSQLLHRPGSGRHPAELVAAIGGAQAQEPLAGRLSLRARDATLTAAGVDRARNEERSLLRTWVMRDTMHLIATDDASWMLPLFEPRLERSSRKRLLLLGMDGAQQERALAAIRHGLRDGPVRRPELADAVRAVGVDLDDRRSRNLFHLATVSGECCQGPDEGRQPTLVDRGEWLGKPSGFDRDTALQELARRYLTAFGPATESDFAGWSGLGLRDVRTGLAALRGALVEVELPAGRGFSLGEPRWAEPAGEVRLLAAYDTYLMGHRDREFIAPGKRWQRVMPGGGILRPAIVRDGVAIGTWKIARSGRRIEVRLDPFAKLSRAIRGRIEAEVADVGRFEGRDAILSGSQ